jgi:MFS family permease
VTRRRAPLAAFLIANVISVAGTRISAIAIPWFVLTSTGSAAKTGLVVLVEMVPLVVTKALGGPLIDRFGARRISVLADTASAAAVAAVPLLHAAGALSFPLLLVLVGLAGLTRGPGDASKVALVPGVAEAARMPIERVTGLESTTDRSASIVAPALAGILIAAVGPTTALVADAASFALCAVLIWVGAGRTDSPFVTSCRSEVAGTVQDGDQRQLVTNGESGAGSGQEDGYWRRLHAGWVFLSREPLMRAITVMVCITNLLDAAFAAVLLPVWIRDHGYGPAQIGLLGSAFGITATVGALLAAGYGHRLPRRITYLVGFTLAGAPRFLVLAFGAPIWLVAGVSAVAGFGAGFLNPIIGAIYIDRTPRPLFGRVSSLAESLAWAGIPLGGVLAGAAVATAGLVPALAVAGGIYLVTTTVPGMMKEWRQMDRPRTTEAVTAGQR